MGLGGVVGGILVKFRELMRKGGEKSLENLANEDRDQGRIPTREAIRSRSRDIVCYAGLTRRLTRNVLTGTAKD